MVFTSLFALILSGLASGLVAEELAVATDEAHILVFMLSAPVTIIAHWLFVRWRERCGLIEARVGA